MNKKPIVKYISNMGDNEKSWFEIDGQVFCFETVETYEVTSINKHTYQTVKLGKPFSRALGKLLHYAIEQETKEENK